MFSLLRSFLVEVELADSMASVNLAAGKARQELDELMQSPASMFRLRNEIDVFLRRTGNLKVELVGRAPTHPGSN